MLTIVSWFWGHKYSAGHVQKLENALARNVTLPYRFLLVKPDAGDEPLLPGCLVRMKMFDPEWQERHGIEEKFVSIDLGVVITGNLDPLFDRPEPFVILQGGNSVNPCPYNCGFMMIRTGHYRELWSEFSLDAAARVPFFAFPDDQSWIHYKAPNLPGWKVGPESGIWSFKKRNWPDGFDLPRGARMVVFPGWRKPDHFIHLPWIVENWR